VQVDILIREKQPFQELIRLSEQEVDLNASLEMRLHDPAFFFAYQVADLASKFLNADPEEMDALLDQALFSVGRFIEVDRAHIFRISDDRKTFSNTHEWCGPGISSRIEELKNLSLSDFSYLGEKIASNQAIKIPDLNDFDEDPIFRSHLNKHHVKALLVMPLYFNDQSLGFLALETIESPQRWTSEHFTYVRLLSEVIVNSIVREQHSREIRNAHDSMYAILDSLDAAIYVSDMDNYEVLFTNRYMREQLGTDATGKICWQTIQKNQTGPCSFCTNESLVDGNGNPSAPYQWEFQNQVNLRWYSITDKAIRWVDGRLVRLEIATDITARKQSEDYLLETQKIAHLGTYSLNLITGKWTSSTILEEIFGINGGAEHNIQTWNKMLHPDWREYMMDYFLNEVVGKKQRFDKEYQIIRENDKKPIWIHGIGQLELDETGLPVRMIGTIRDITEQKETELEIKDKEARFRNLFEQSSEGILLSTLDGRILDANQKWLKMFGYEEDELASLRLSQLHPEESQAMIRQSKNELLIRGSSHYTPVCLRKNGDAFLSEISASVIEYQGKRLIQSIERDITEKKETEDWLKKLSMAVEQSPVSVIITDTNGNIEYTNAHFEKVTGYSRQEVLGKNPRFLKSNETSDEDYKQLWETISSGREWEGEFHNKRKDGSLYWESGHISPIFNEQGEITHYLGVKENVTLKKEYEERILQQAHYDALTGLPNRFLVTDRLKQAIAQSVRNRSSMALMYIDLDDFKKVNDTMGHQAGDTILIDAAQRLRYMIREGDTVGRLGGDEFVVVLGQISAYADAEIVAEKILRAFNKPFMLDNVEIVLTTSIGIAMYPHDSQDEQQLMRNADTAMYRSKDEGRNTYNFFDESMKTEVLRRLEVEHQLRYALSKNEFYMTFQPIMDLVSGATSGAEALIRWNNPELGMVAPDEFIPLAEQTGLINEIGRFVLHESCNAMQRINEITGENYYLAINISPHQFRKNDFVSQVRAALDETGFPADLLEIEITEGLLLQMNETINKAFHQLHDMGIKFSMDDFGTGYSSLSYLRNFPFDVLKIDRTFIGDLSNNPEDKALISATIAMARNLGLTVIGEGVEDATQLGILREEACQRAQGYLFSHPMTEPDFINWIMKQRSRAPN
jgi:diguanylate cyclase (GGDEF)-like protein/PAS domain S-box-containing protein